MHVKDARGFCDMGQFGHAGFDERDLGFVVTGLPTLFHGTQSFDAPLGPITGD